MSPKIVFDFDKNSALSNWYILDDTVMGGRSAGNFKINNYGHGEFYGKVSLENNGGFSSVRHIFEQINTANYSRIILKIKGDGKNYQFRIKDSRRNYYSYVAEFTTTGKWQEVEIPFSTMYPSFRGRKLNAPNYPGNQAEEIAFLIGNKKPQDFKLVIDKIELQ